MLLKIGLIFLKRNVMSYVCSDLDICSFSSSHTADQITNINE